MIKETYKIYYNVLGVDGKWTFNQEFIVEVNEIPRKGNTNRDSAWKLGWMKITEKHPGKTFSIVSVNLV